MHNEMRRVGTGLGGCMPGGARDPGAADDDDPTEPNQKLAGEWEAGPPTWRPFPCILLSPPSPYIHALRSIQNEQQ
jgi:hypothetical protein